MTSASDSPNTLEGIGRIWLGPVREAAEVRLFRRTFDVPEKPATAVLDLFAETGYVAYLNGQWVQRGPWFHHPHRLPVARLDLGAQIRAGRNVLAVAVWTLDRATHNHIPTDWPGLIANLTLTADDGTATSITTDEGWTATDATGWDLSTPRRNWALGPIEAWDAAAGDPRWREPDYDPQWAPADVHPSPALRDDVSWLVQPLPLLRSEFVPATNIRSVETAPARPFDVRGQESQLPYGEMIDGMDWTPLEMSGDMEWTDLKPDQAVAIWADLGKEHVGQIALEVETDSAGTIDVAWSEILHDGRPKVTVKGTTYADQVTTPGGAIRFEPVGFSGMRYIGLVFRGFAGGVRIRRWGLMATEPDLPFATSFHCDDEGLQAVWDMCFRCLRIGTQEGLMDCPSREQASYIGDGHPVARWTAWLTGDYRHWRYLVEEQFARPNAAGLVRTTLFTGARSKLVDYDLLAIIGTRDYYNETRDRATIENVLPAARGVLDAFRRRRDDSGLLAIGDAEPHNGSHTWEQRYAGGDWDDNGVEFLFIDHPGLGWHNVGEPGIDRSGRNAAANALYVVATRALADLEDALDTGQADALRAEADQHAEKAMAFFDGSRGVFADGLQDGTHLAQISQQTNTWCLWAHLLEGDAARETMSRVLADIGQWPDLARSGPYFWYYMFEVLRELGMHAEGLRHAKSLWKPMIAAGATTCWETFAGDEKDTWCHPWSSAALDFILRGIVGVDFETLAEGHIVLTPRPDLAGKISASIHTIAGCIIVDWQEKDGRAELSVRLPDRLRAEIRRPDGSLVSEATGLWTGSIG